MRKIELFAVSTMMALDYFAAKLIIVWVTNAAANPYISCPKRTAKF
jgi:hypothetical protein